MPSKHVGKNTGLKNQYGKPIYEKDGERFSERSTTLEIEGRYINAPTIYGPVELTSKEVEDGVYSGNIQPTSTHATERQAVRAAVMRSKNMQHRGRQAGESTEKSR